MLVDGGGSGGPSAPAARRALSAVDRQELVDGYAVMRDHHLVDTDEKERDGETTRKKRKNCELCRKKDRQGAKKPKTKSVCAACRMYLCGNKCLNKHHNDVLRERALARLG